MSEQEENSGFWKGKKVLVTGGSGFIGSHLVEELVKYGCNISVTTYPQRVDLTNIKKFEKDVKIFKGDLKEKGFAKEVMNGQDYVIHLAARVAGVNFSQSHPATMFIDNIEIFMKVIEAARKAGVKRFLTVSSAAVYPNDCTIPAPEDEGFKGIPDGDSIGYGWAKRMKEFISESYFKEYGFQAVIVRPFNTFGPRDNFNPETAHVVPALIARVFSGENPLKVWGDGKQTRSFIYCRDFAQGLITALEKAPPANPINIGTSEETTIGEIAKIVVEELGRNTQIEFDMTKPSGHPRRACDVKKAKELMGFEAKFSLRKGIKETIEWYQRNIG